MPRVAKLRQFGKVSKPAREYDEAYKARQAENEKKLCEYCGKRNRRAMERLCQTCGRRYYLWGTCNEKFKAFGLHKVVEQLSTAKSIIQKNIAAPGTVLALKFFETLMADSLKLPTIMDLSPEATALVRRWAERQVKPIDLLVVAAGLTLVYYLDRGLIVDDRNLHYVMGNHLIRMVSYMGATTGAVRKTIGGLVYNQIGAYLVTVAKVGVEYTKKRDAEQAAMAQPLEMPDADEKPAE
jgi:hypothetical protein